MNITKMNAFFKYLDDKPLNDIEIVEAIKSAKDLKKTISPSIINKVQQFGMAFPDYLTRKEIKEADSSYITVAYLDLLALAKEKNLMEVQNERRI